MIPKTHQEIFNSYIINFLDLYKLLAACLLSVFVPQFCEDTGTTCTFNENFQNLSIYNIIVLVINFITLFMYINLNYVQQKREVYFITHLEVNKNIADNALNKSILTHSRILNRVSDHNNLVYNYSIYTLLCFSINVLLSCILVFYYFYDGFRSVTTMVTNVLLVSHKLYTTISISHRCINSPQISAISIGLTGPVQYNDIDEAYTLKTNPELTQSIEQTTI